MARPIQFEVIKYTFKVKGHQVHMEATEHEMQLYSRCFGHGLSQEVDTMYLGRVGVKDKGY